MRNNSYGNVKEKYITNYLINDSYLFIINI